MIFGPVVPYVNAWAIVTVAVGVAVILIARRPRRQV